MNYKCRFFVSLIMAVSLVAFSSISAGRIQKAVKASGLEKIKVNETPQIDIQEFSKSINQLPMSFEANTGQIDRRVKFTARGQGYKLFLTGHEAVLNLQKTIASSPNNSSGKEKINAASGNTMRIKLIGANRRIKTRGVEELPVKSNYFIGNDPRKWRTNVPNYARVEFENVYPGVDAVYYGNQRQIEYDFVVSPGTDPARIKLGFEGVRKISIDKDGDLILKMDDGEVRQTKPLIYQEINGKRHIVEGEYLKIGKSEIAFKIGAYDRSRPLTIDPVLIYSTFLGGTAGDGVSEVAVDGDGNAFVTGHTSGAGFPTSSGAFDAGFSGGATDAFVTKLNGTGTAAVFSTYFGGSDSDQGDGIGVDASGNIYVGGLAKSINFPTTVGAYDTTCTFCGNGGGGNPPGDAFIAKFDPAGALLKSTLYGAGDYEHAIALALDSSGNVYIGGGWAGGFCNCLPTLNGFQSSRLSYYDSFLAKFNSDLSSLLYATVVGGSNDDYAVLDIAANSPDVVSITGVSRSMNLPTTSGAFDSVCGTSPAQHDGIFDAYVMKINTAASGGASLVFSTCVGGSGDEGGSGVAVEPDGTIWVTGGTSSADFPTTPGGFDTTYNLGGDAFVTRLNPFASGAGQLVYSSYIGGSGNDGAAKIRLEGAPGIINVAGTTQSSNFPIADSLHPYAGMQDAFIVKLNTFGNTLIFSSYFGGCFNDSASTLAVDLAGNMYIGGATASPGLTATSGAYQNAYGGNGDGWVAKISAGGATIPLGGCGSSLDDDGDGVANTSDNCPAVANANQANADGDAQGDVCDADDDNDGVTDANDAFPFDPAESADTDGDAIGNNADQDDDGDGQLDADETACGSDPLNVADKAADSDGDNSPNCIDSDDDNDGIADTCDADSNPGAADYDHDGIVDGSNCDQIIGPPTNKEQCKNGGWQFWTRADGSKFKNQGDCIQFVNTGK